MSGPNRRRKKKGPQRRPESKFLDETRMGQHVLKILIRMPHGFDDVSARLLSLDMANVVDEALPNGAECEMTLRKHGDTGKNMLAELADLGAAVMEATAEPVEPANVVGRVELQTYDVPKALLIKQQAIDDLNKHGPGPAVDDEDGG